MVLELYNTLDSNLDASWTSSHQNLTSSFMPIHFYSISMFRLCQLSQFLLYQDIQTLLTFTISIISGHSDFHNFYCIRTFRLCWFSQLLLHQDIQTLLTLTISIRSFRLSQFLSGHSDIADFHNFYQDIQTLLTFTISIISGHSDFCSLSHSQKSLASDVLAEESLTGYKQQ